MPISYELRRTTYFIISFIHIYAVSPLFLPCVLACLTVFVGMYFSEHCVYTPRVSFSLFNKWKIYIFVYIMNLIHVVHSTYIWLRKQIYIIIVLYRYTVHLHNVTLCVIGSTYVFTYIHTTFVQNILGEPLKDKH